MLLLSRSSFLAAAKRYQSSSLPFPLFLGHIVVVVVVVVVVGVFVVVVVVVVVVVFVVVVVVVGVDWCRC